MSTTVVSGVGCVGVGTSRPGTPASGSGTVVTGDDGHGGVVTTTVTGGPEIVAEGETGLLCEPGDPISLADALEVLLLDPERARAMGLAGRRRAERLFDLTTNVGQLTGHFARVTPPRSSRGAA